MKTNPFSPAADPRDQLAICETAVHADGWFAAAGIEEVWPVSTDVAARLLVAGEYSVSPLGLEDLIRRRLLQAPAIDDDGRHEWSAVDLVAAAGILEGREQWLPTPCRHDPKKHATRITLEQAREAGDLESVAHAGPVLFDVRYLLVLLTQCPNFEGRVKIAALLEAVLEVDHGVTL